MATSTAERTLDQVKVGDILRLDEGRDFTITRIEPMPGLGYTRLWIADDDYYEMFDGETVEIWQTPAAVLPEDHDWPAAPNGDTHGQRLTALETAVVTANEQIAALTARVAALLAPAKIEPYEYVVEAHGGGDVETKGFTHHLDLAKGRADDLHERRTDDTSYLVRDTTTGEIVYRAGAAEPERDPVEVIGEALAAVDAARRHFGASIAVPELEPVAAPAPAPAVRLSKSDVLLLQRLVSGWRLAKRNFSANYVCIDPGHTHHNNVVSNRVDDLLARGLIDKDLKIAATGRAALAERDGAK